MSSDTVRRDCPYCRYSDKVSVEIVGRKGNCPTCRALLAVKEMTWKSILELAGVDGHAETTLYRNNGSKPGSRHGPITPHIDSY